jgi:UDP-N-acetylmuramoyl-L-alanyl-D-glutamate--2,6-diaminopimelate ligase
VIALTLSELAREVSAQCTHGGDTTINGVKQDSREVEPGDLFVVRKGASHDGAKYIEQAIAKGAVALFGEPDLARCGYALPIVTSSDARSAAAKLASAVYGHPSFALQVLGITGTNGKTTTAHLLRDALDAAVGRSETGILGTVGHRFRDVVFPTKHTTPEADELARVLSSMKELGARYAAIEVSSIALSEKRVEGTRFAAAGFTNFTQDHLDYHGSMQAYGEAKSRLFLELGPGASIINVADPFGNALAEKVSGPCVRVSAVPGVHADIEVVRASFDLQRFGMQAQIRAFGKDFELHSSLLGAHNLENTVVALGFIHALGLDIERGLSGIAKSLGVPGRLERCDLPGDALKVLVDYAHTPDALERVLSSLRAVSQGSGGRLLCVFGCGGDRDPLKRGPMGDAVGRLADIAIVTSDNPRSEDPDAIAVPIVNSLKALGVSKLDGAALGTHSKGFYLEQDRARAIELAVLAARSNDIVLIAGKGHEPYQIIGSEIRNFDDRDHARAALRLRQAGKV